MRAAEPYSPMRDEPTVLGALFGVLNAGGVDYCVMGDADSLFQVPDNDIDIVCAKGTLPAIADVLAAFASQFDGRIVQALQYGPEAMYYVVYLPLSRGNAAYLKIDVCAGYVSGGRRLLDGAWLLERRTRRQVGAAHFWVAAAEREFIYYLLKKIRKGEADAKALQHLSRLWAVDPGCRAALRRYWSSTPAGFIEQGIVGKSWAPIEANLGVIRRELDERLSRQGPAAFLGEAKRRLERYAHPAGFVVAVLGPDGSGKSTLLSALTPRLDRLGRTTASFHFTPPLLPGGRSGGATSSDPHSVPPRGPLLSTVKLAYLALVANIGWLGSVWMQRRRSGMVIFDRYFHDILADPLRYRNSAPAWVVRGFARLIPTPDLFLVLDVRPDVVRARKSEVSAEEGERQFTAYRALCAALPNGRLIDANRAPEDVVAQCEDHIVRALADRLQRRVTNASR